MITLRRLWDKNMPPGKLQAARNQACDVREEPGVHDKIKNSPRKEAKHVEILAADFRLGLTASAMDLDQSRWQHYTSLIPVSIALLLI